jgi:hypothetical protein
MVPCGSASINPSFVKRRTLNRFLHGVKGMKPFALPLLFIVALPFIAPTADAASGEATGCAEIGGASFWASTGWSHVVYLTNRCSRTITCEVSTNVDPEVHRTDVATNITVQVVTTTGSPERVFVPKVMCDYAPSVTEGVVTESRISGSPSQPLAP